MPTTHTRRPARTGRRARIVGGLCAAGVAVAVVVPLAAVSAASPSLDANSEIRTAATATKPAERIRPVTPPSTVPSAGSDKPIFPMQTEPHCLALNNYGAARPGRTHVGLDIMADTEVGPTQAIYAVVDGTLSYQYIHNTTSGALSGNGWRLTSAVTKTYYTYLHMSTFGPGLQVGSKVRQGDLIGYVGDTGNDPGNYHLHFEVHPTGTSGYTVNPLTVLTIPPECR